MSYRCDRCNQAQESGERPTFVVTKIRQYNPQPGSEIVEEVGVCVDCDSTLSATPPEIVEVKEISQSPTNLPPPPGDQSWRTRA
jgi:hypothetical protein